MEEPTATPTGSSSPSLGAIVSGIVSSPGEVFAGLANSPSRTSHWLFPFLFTLLAAIATPFVIHSSQALRTQMADLQMTQVQKQVEKGQMPQDRADQMRESMESESYSGFFYIGIASIVIFTAIGFFVAPLFLMLGGKVVLKTPQGYGKYLEAYGVSSWIGILGAVVGLLMIRGLESLHATPTLALPIYASFEVTNTLHNFLGSVDFFGAWQTAALGIAYSKFSGRSTTSGLSTAFGLWAAYIIIKVGLAAVFQS